MTRSRSATWLYSATFGVIGAIAAIVGSSLAGHSQLEQDSPAVLRLLVERRAGAVRTTFGAGLSYADFLALTHLRSIQEFGASAERECDVHVSGELIPSHCSLVAGEYFKLKNAAALLGRLLTPGDDSGGAARVAVISAKYWKEYFGSEPNIIGRVLTISGGRYRVVGVVAPTSSDLESATNRLWVPLQNASLWPSSRGLFESPTSSWLTVILKLDSSGDVQQATSDIEGVLAANAQKDSKLDSHPRVKLLSPRLSPPVLPRSDHRHAEGWFLVVLLVLAVLTVSNSVALASTPETPNNSGPAARFGQRNGGFSLGVLLTGSALAVASSVTLLFVIGSYARIAADIWPWPMVSAFAVVVTLGLFGATYLLRVLLAAFLTGAANRRSVWQRCSLTFQLAIAALLVVFAIRAVAAYLRVDEQVAARQLRETLGIVTVSLPGSWSREDNGHFAQQATSRLRLVGGLAAWALSYADPIRETAPTFVMVNASGHSEVIPVHLNYVSASYFRTVSSPVVRGSVFSGEEAKPQAVVDSPSGKLSAREITERDCISDAIEALPSYCVPIVGSTNGISMSAPSAVGLQHVFLPWSAAPDSRQFHILVRSSGPLAAKSDELFRTLAATDTNVKEINVESVGDIIVAQLSAWRLRAVCLAALALCAVMIALAGIWPPRQTVQNLWFTGASPGA